MTNEEQQTASSSPSEKWTPPVRLPEPPEEDTDHSVFPHFWICVPIALALCWHFYDLFGGRLFFYKIGASGGYGPVYVYGPAWVLIPLLFGSLLFFAYWNMRFAREAGDTKKQSLFRGVWTMGGVFVVAAFVVWLLILNLKWG